MESFQGTDWGPGVDPGLQSTGRGNSIRAERRRSLTIFVITISTLIQDHQGFAYSSSQTEVGVSWADFTRPQPHLQYTLLLF